MSVPHSAFCCCYIVTAGSDAVSPATAFLEAPQTQAT
jgi:hypothetical protein